MAANGVGVEAVVCGALHGAPGRQVVVILSHAPTPPDGFKRLPRDELVQAMAVARSEASRTSTVQVVLLHVPNDTAMPSAVGREADVVLVVSKARHG